MVHPKERNDAALTKIWIKKILCKHTKKIRALLLWETFSGHMTDDVEQVTSEKISGGLISKIQPLDISLNKPSFLINGSNIYNRMFFNRMKEIMINHHQNNKWPIGLMYIQREEMKLFKIFIIGRYMVLQQWRI